MLSPLTASTDGRVGGVVDFSTPFDLVSGSLYPATSLISVNTLVDSPDPTPQQEYVNLEGKEVAERETVKVASSYTADQLVHLIPISSLTSHVHRLLRRMPMWSHWRTKPREVLLSGHTTTTSELEEATS